MNFCEAMKYAKDGYSVACIDWEDNEYIIESDGSFYFVGDGDTFSIKEMRASVIGMLKTDWYVFKNFVSFTEAMERVHQGCSIRHKDWPSNRYIFEVDGLLQIKSGEFVSPFCICSVEDAKQIVENNWVVMIR